jgi:hypothetical protein
MLVEPVLPPIGTPDAAANGPLAADRARIARGWLAHGIELAARPGVVDPTAAIAGALDQALEAIAAALEAHGHDVGALAQLHLARDEVREGIARLAEPTPDARLLAIRHARLADRVLDEALAVIDPTLDLPDPEHVAR